MHVHSFITNLTSVKTALEGNYIKISADAIVPSVEKPQEKLRDVYDKIRQIVAGTTLHTLTSDELTQAQTLIKDISAKLEARNQGYLRKVNSIWTLRGIKRLACYRINIIAHFLLDGVARKTSQTFIRFVNFVFTDYRGIGRRHTTAYNSVRLSLTQIEGSITTIAESQKSKIAELERQKATLAARSITPSATDQTLTDEQLARKLQIEEQERERARLSSSVTPAKTSVPPVKTPVKTSVPPVKTPAKTSVPPVKTSVPPRDSRSTRSTSTPIDEAAEMKKHLIESLLEKARKDGNAIQKMWGQVRKSYVRDIKSKWIELLNSVKELSSHQPLETTLNQLRTDIHFPIGLIPSDGVNLTALLTHLSNGTDGSALVAEEYKAYVQTHVYESPSRSETKAFAIIKGTDKLLANPALPREERGARATVISHRFSEFDKAIEDLTKRRTDKERSLKKGAPKPGSLKIEVVMDLEGAQLTPEIEAKLKELSKHLDVYSVRIINTAGSIAGKDNLLVHEGEISVDFKDLSLLTEFLNEKRAPTAAVKINCTGTLNVEHWKKVMAFAERADVSIINLDNLPANLVLPPEGLTEVERDAFFRALNKIQTHNPVSINFETCKFTSNDEMESIYRSFPRLKDNHLILQKAPLNVANFFLSKYPECDQLDLTGSDVTVSLFKSWQNDGLLSRFWKINLSNCSKLNTDVIESLARLPNLTKVPMPEDLSFTEARIPQHLLPKSNNPFAISELYCQCAALRPYAASHYTGPQEYAVVFQIPLAKAGIPFTYQKGYQSLDPETAFYLLTNNSYQSMPANPYISKVCLDFVGAVNNENLLPFLEKFPHADLHVSLQGCANITIEAFKKEGQINLAALQKIKRLDLRGTALSEDERILLLTEVPHLVIDGYRKYEGSIEAEKAQLLSLFTPDGDNDAFLLGVSQQIASLPQLSALYLFPSTAEGIQKYVSPDQIEGTEKAIYVIKDRAMVTKYIVNSNYHDEPEMKQLFEVTQDNVVEKYLRAAIEKNYAMMRICRTFLELFAKDQLDQTKIAEKAFSPIDPEFADFKVTTGSKNFLIHKHLWTNKSLPWAHTFAFEGEGYVASEQPLESDPSMDISMLFELIHNYFYKGDVGKPLTAALAADLLWLADLYKLSDLMDTCYGILEMEVLAQNPDGKLKAPLSHVAALYLVASQFAPNESIANACADILKRHKKNPAVVAELWQDDVPTGTQPSWETLIFAATTYLNNSRTTLIDITDDAAIAARLARGETPDETTLFDGGTDSSLAAVIARSLTEH